MRNIGIGTVALLACLFGLLVLAIIWAISVWNASSEGDPMGAHGWIALALGTFFSLTIGGGLMMLMFYSARSGHDEAADPLRRKRDPE